jgi:hypothetical protein
MKKNCLAFLILYCAIFTWLAVPFVMADGDLLRNQGLTLQAELISHQTVTAQADMQDLQTRPVR